MLESNLSRKIRSLIEDLGQEPGMIGEMVYKSRDNNARSKMKTLSHRK